MKRYRTTASIVAAAAITIGALAASHPAYAATIGRAELVVADRHVGERYLGHDRTSFVTGPSWRTVP